MPLLCLQKYPFEATDEFIGQAQCMHKEAVEEAVEAVEVEEV